jgi:hypothetical protein
MTAVCLRCKTVSVLKLFEFKKHIISDIFDKEKF